MVCKALHNDSLPAKVYDNLGDFGGGEGGGWRKIVDETSTKYAKAN